MADNKKGYRKLIDLRNKFLLNQVNFNQFLKELEIILYNYLSINAVEMAGGAGHYCYTTIGRRLLSDEIGASESILNLKIDLLYYEI